MNKLFTTFTLLISSVCFCQAQDGYIKYNTNTEYRNKTVKVFKGEIVPFIKVANTNKINVIIGNDTITDLTTPSKMFEGVKSTNTTYNLQKEDFLQLKKNGFVWVNATAIPNSDTVILISESGNQLTQLIDKREAQVNQADLGKTFRLLISNSPTLFYSADKLKHFVEPEQVQVEENSKTENDEMKKVGWAWWYYAIIVIGIGCTGFGIWKFIKTRRQVKEPIYAVYKYTNKGLSDFAIENGTDLESLLKWNKEIDRNYQSYNTSDKKSVQKELINKPLIVGYKLKSLTESNNTFSIDKENILPATKEWQELQESNYQPTNFGNNELSSQLRQMEDKLFREIQKLSSGYNNSNLLNELRREKTELENKLKTVESDKRNADANLMQMQSANSTLESKLQIANDEMDRVQNEVKTLQEKIIALDFLKGYSESVFSYLKFCQQVVNDAYSLLNRISQQNPKQIFAVGYLLMKYQSNVNAIPVGNWLQTVQDIKDTGATTNRQLNRSFSQIQNESDKQKEFQRLLFSEVLTKYSSSLLILAEAFKNLSRFQGSTDFENEAQNTFGKHVSEIVSKAKSTGLEIKHVSLFENWEKHIGQVEDNGGDRSLAYKEISGLEKGAIAEIVSFGVKTSFEDTKTIIILA